MSAEQGENPRGPGLKSAPSVKPSLVERALAGFVVGEEDCLPDVPEARLDGLQQLPPHPSSLAGRVDEDVLQVTDGRVVGDRAGQADQIPFGVPGAVTTKDESSMARASSAGSRV